MSFEKNLPPDIASKIALLKEHRETILKLSVQCEYLEKEISTYHDSIAPVKKCPQEVLSMIFQDYLSKNPRLIRRLMLVCRSWHRILVSTPTFWTEIPIIINTNYADAKEVADAEEMSDTEEVADAKVTDAKEVADSITPRLLAFCDRSQSLPLRISMDLQWFEPVESIFGRKVEDLCTVLFPDSEEFRAVDWYERYGDELEGSLDAPWHPNHVFNALLLLIGSNNQHRKRWASLEVILPSNHATRSLVGLWNLFTGPTPQLSHIRIEAPDGFTEDMPPLVIFPDLSSLQSLSVNDGDLLEHLDLSSSPLIHLRVCYRSATNLNNLPLQSLQSLELQEGYVRSQSLNLNLVLSRVKNIIFKGPFGRTESLEIAAPSLERIRIEDGAALPINRPNSLSPKHISWLLSRSYEVHRWIPNILTELLQDYKTMRTFTVSKAVEESLKAVLDRMKQAHELPASLALIHIVDNQDFERVIETWTVR